MSDYDVVWEPDVAGLMLDLDDPTFEAVTAGAARLAASPTGLSRPDGHPYYGLDQRYGFDAADGRVVTLFFKYSQDEASIHITDVSVLPPG